jgi:outer membrane receptor for ferrienterochelin and colicins
MKQFIKIILLLLLPFFGLAQTLKGSIVNDKNEPLMYASLQWQSDKTRGAQTDEKGAFEIQQPAFGDSLIVTYIGYKATKYWIAADEHEVLLELKNAATLTEVQIKAARRDNFVSTMTTLNVEKIGAGELRKAACCNLAESFETNGTVDIGYSDAVTGAKEIEMLGLRGNYTQTMVEAMPILAGLQTPYALEYYAGTWLNDIAISKGASTVVNGSEGIAGQINACLKQPEKMERFLFNAFGSTQGRVEANLHFSHHFNKKLHTSILSHADRMLGLMDKNGDGFMDMPQKTQYNIMNRWQYDMGSWRGQTTLHWLDEAREGGTMTHNTDASVHHSGAPDYRFGMETNRAQVFGKLGYVGFKEVYKGFGLQYSALSQNMKGIIGAKTYTGTQNSGYINAMYETIISTTDHKIKVGGNFVYNDFNENYTQNRAVHIHDLPDTIATKIIRKELISGVYGEYNYNYLQKFGLLVGARADLHNTYGLWLTPRLSAKYNFDENTIVRASAGRGIRTASVLMENISLFTSNRFLSLTQNVLPESAWNYGLNFTKNFKIDMNEGNFAIDLYRTDFENQLVADLDVNARTIVINNLDGGKSYSKSLLATVNYDVLPRFEVRLAAKFTDVQQTTNGILQQKILQPQFRALLNLHYETFDKDWNFNVVTHFIGEQRLPEVVLEQGYSAAIPQYRLNKKSPAFFTMAAQVNKKFGKRWELYAGGENLTNYTQTNPILFANDPQNPAFDAATVFAPLVGVMGYVGVRYVVE